MTSDIEALSMLFQEGIVNLLVQIFTLLVITMRSSSTTRCWRSSRSW